MMMMIYSIITIILSHHYVSIHAENELRMLWHFFLEIRSFGVCYSLDKNVQHKFVDVLLKGVFNIANQHFLRNLCLHLLNRFN